LPVVVEVEQQQLQVVRVLVVLEQAEVTQLNFLDTTQFQILEAVAVARAMVQLQD
jgi:hypothetical protein